MSDRGLRRGPSLLPDDEPISPEQIGQAYDRITELWTRDGFNLNNGIDALHKAIAFTRQQGRALDVGCGCTGRFFTVMETAGFQPEGVDISADMLAIVREKRPDIPFYHADICQWDLPVSYDLITAWDSIWHIPLAQQRPVMEKLLKGLNPGGVCLFSCGGVDQAGGHRNDFMGPTVYYSSLGVTGFLQLIADCDCTCRHLEYDQFPELHLVVIVEKNPPSAGGFC